MEHKPGSLEEAAQHVLKLEEAANDKKYKWGDINDALVEVGFGSKVIVKVAKALRGKEQ